MDKTCINCACDKVCNHDLFGFENCGNFMPAEDVIKVVRCKDCKHLTDDGFCWQNIHAVVGYKMPSPNDYCSYGTRKDGAGMPEYIEREAFIKRLENEADKSSDIINLLILNGIANIVRDENIAPAADVVEVVRCKDCEHAKEYKNNFFCCYYPVTPKSVSSDDFCSYGERKDGEENGL